ncbi:MAG: hypothetical protein AAF292_17180 [Pseudomonadota bacterium]
MPFDDYRNIAETDAKHIRAELIKAFNDTSAGRETGRLEVSHTHATGERTEQNKRKKSARQFLRDIQRIIEDGELAGYMADKIIGAKSNADIADMVSRIKAKTGLTLQEYAAGIIGADDALRRPGETEAHYNRRIITAVTAEIIDPATGRIKKQYENDVLAQIILADEAYRDILASVDRINRNEFDADGLVQTFADAGYIEAEAAGQHVENNAHKGNLRDAQNAHADQKNNSEQIAADAESFFASVPPRTVVGTKPG